MIDDEKFIINPDCRCRVICFFTKFDFLKLERVIGTSKAKEFLADYNKISSFMINI